MVSSCPYTLTSHTVINARGISLGYNNKAFASCRTFPLEGSEHNQDELVYVFPEVCYPVPAFPGPIPKYLV